MSGLTRLGIVFGLTILLAACGSGDAETPWDLDDETANGTTDGTTDDTTDGTTPVVPEEVFLLGSGSGVDFVPGVLDIAVPNLSAGGLTTITASVADDAGNLYQDTASVTFSSPCASQGLAEIISPIPVNGGFASTTYTATGCAGTDTITATTTIATTTSTAIGNVQVQAAVVGSLNFDSAVPELIGIKGTGLNEVATVQFRVLDTNGNPAVGEDVNFSLNTTIGGITFDPPQDTSDLNGLVRTYVQSGTVSTTVRVTATLVSNPSISTQSGGLTISTGIADQNSFSISASVFNPEAWNYDGEEVTISILASDHFNNPVADGTAVYFTTEGGQIVSQCEITDGGCSVIWRSSEPRPTDDGRVTILATAIGEESFTDANANGVLDDLPDAYTDLDEAFRDDNEDGAFDPTEELRELDGNGSFDLADGEYNGVLCDLTGDPIINTSPNVCSTTKNTYVRNSLVLVMSGSSINIEFADAFLDASSESLATTDVIVSDLHDQPPPAGTIIGFSTSNGDLESAGSITIPSTNFDGKLAYGIRIRGDTETSSGTLTVTATTPKGLISTAYLTVND